MAREGLPQSPRAVEFWTRDRVAKCHEYDEYIRAKFFAGWGKKSGRRCNLAKI